MELSWHRLGPAIVDDQILPCLERVGRDKVSRHLSLEETKQSSCSIILAAWQEIIAFQPNA